MIKIKMKSEVCHLHQVRCSDEAVPLLVEHSKSLPDLVLNVGIFELPGHDGHSWRSGEGSKTAQECIYSRLILWGGGGEYLYEGP